MAFGIDFTNLNQSIFEDMRDAFGFGTDIPIGNQTLFECIKKYAEKSSSTESSVIADYNKQMKATLTKGVEALKARQIIYFFEKAAFVYEQRNIEKDPILVSTHFSFTFINEKCILTIYFIDGHSCVYIS